MLQLLTRANPAGKNCVLEQHALSPGLEAQKGPGAKKAVTSQPFPADNAFEEKRPISFLDLAKGAYRGERVATRSNKMHTQIKKTSSPIRTSTQPPSSRHQNLM